MATGSQLMAARIRAAKAELGRRAAMAVGDDIPRPRPVAEAMPAPTVIGFEPDLSAASDPAIAADQWVPLARKEVAFRQGDGEPLTLEETRTLALALEQQGVDPFFLFSDEVFPEDFKPAIDAALAADTRVLTPEQAAEVVRRIERGEDVPPEVVAALRRSQPQSEPELPTPPPAPAEGGAVVPQSIQQVGGGKSPRFVVVGADGQELGEAARVGNKNLYTFGGRQYAIDDTGAGVVEVGAATQPAPLDNLEQSGFDIGTGSGLTPNKKRSAKIDMLAERIRQATTQTDTESVAGLRRMQAEVASLSDAERQALLEHPALAEGIESIEARRNPAAREAALANAQRRLESLAEKSGVSTADRAAEQVATAADARSVAATPRSPSPDRAAAQQAFASRAQLLEESLPEGDWARLTEAFNKLDPERKAAVIARLPTGRSLRAGAGGRASLDPRIFKDPNVDARMRPLAEEQVHPLAIERGETDTNAPREMLTALLDNSTGEPAFLPNAVPQLTAGSGGLDAALMELDAATRTGDADLIEQARLNVQTFPASPEEMQAAKRTFLQRQAAAAALRNAIIGTDPLYVSEQARMLASQVAPAPRPAITPGARSIEVATEDVADAELPGMFETARAAERERQAQLAQRSPGGGTPIQQRLEAAGVAKAQDLPLGLRSSSDPNRQPPLERRSPSEWPIQTDDMTAIQQAQELQAAIQEVSEELRLAQVRRDETAVAAAQTTLRSLAEMEDKLFKPRLVKASTGGVKEVPPAMLRGEAEVPKGWTIERGTPARSDRRINAGGSQETLDNALVSIVGGRPKMASSMPRSNADMSAAERARIRDNVEITYGDDAIEYLPDEPEGELPELGQDGTRARTGSSRQESRVIGGLRTLFGDDNPLSWTVPADRGAKVPLYPNADAVAEDLLSRNTVGWSKTHTLADGTQQASAGYEVAKRSLADAIERHYGPTAARKRPDMAGEEAVTSRPATDAEPATDAGVSDNLDGSNVEIADTTGEDQAVAADQKPRRGRGKKAAGKTAPAADAAAGNASSDPVVNPVTASDELDAATLQEIEDEADALYDATKRNYLDMGEDDSGADFSAKEARGKYVTEQRAARKGKKPASGDPQPVTGTDPTAADNVSDNLAASATEIDDTTGTNPWVTSKPKDADAPKKPDADAPSKPKDADGKSKTDPASDTKKKGWGWWPTAAVVGGVGGLGVLARMGGGAGSGQIDIPLPPGGGAGGPGGGGGYVPVPPGGSAAAMDEAMAQELAIQRALERIRGSRPASDDRGPYQTPMNYSIWR